MSRGDFGTLRDSNAYKSSRKKWYVELLQSDMFWYELIANEHGEFNTKKLISDSLKDLKTLVENQLDKRFIYFIASRKRLRFSEKKKPKYSLFGNKLYLYIEVGRERKTRRIATQFRDSQTGQALKPKVETTDKFITFTYHDGNKATVSIHDFLLISDIELGYDSEVQYVGYTKNPQKRPIDGTHTGLNEIIYRLSNEDNDIFVFYNLFKVTTSAINEEFNINFHVSNAMIDEIQVDKEGQILEKCLILYFGSDNQTKNRENEKRELQNNLIQLANENKITSITVHYEMENPNEYYRFCSSSVAPNDCHIFSCMIKENDLIFGKGSKLHDEVFGQPV